ncbi:hypothetical protein [Leptolyngbya iicbica]|uniref:Nitrate reductase n=2 Tax=Cyanophyceae TaxID=3028117 RepID=A0A4Q7E844_9CYAN|nr:hypothetical protein [Leptolyngbya sp. LK]RZM78762.1 hypothetical protein DYY88_08165 [Leptolyngbya sp. LK]
MNLFKQSRPTANPGAVQQIKTWVYEGLALSTDVPISISQLQCHEPGCPPIETVIAVMAQPTQTYKIHAAAADITQAQVLAALHDETPHCN